MAFLMARLCSDGACWSTLTSDARSNELIRTLAGNGEPFASRSGTGIHSDARTTSQPRVVLLIVCLIAQMLTLVVDLVCHCSFSPRYTVISSAVEAVVRSR